MLPVEKPLVMIGRQGSRRLVLALDKAAKAAGIRPGTPVSKAQALVPGLLVEELDAAGDARALQQLAFHFLRIYAPSSPLIHRMGWCWTHQARTICTAMRR